MATTRGSFGLLAIMLVMGGALVLGHAPAEVADLVLPTAAADDEHCAYVDPQTGQVIIYPGSCPPNGP